MAVVRVIIIFLCGVAATTYAYVSGYAQRVPEWFGYGETTVISTPSSETVVTSTPGDSTIVTTPPGALVTTTAGPGLEAPPPPPDSAGPPFKGEAYKDGGFRDGDFKDDGFKHDRFKDRRYGEGYDDRGDAYPGPYPVTGETVVTKGDAVFANGSPLRVKIFRSDTGFEARCTAYKVVNRSQRVLMLSFDPPPNGEAEGVVPPRAIAEAGGTLLKPGETLDDDSFPVECAEFRSLFGEGRDYGPPGRRGDGRGFGGPRMKIVIEDCPQDNCAVAQF